jgi:hypothetical protein
VAGLRSLPVGVLAIVGSLLLATVGGLVALWPDEDRGPKLDESLRAPTYDAEVVALQPIRCQSPEARGCNRIRAELLEGPDQGETIGFASGESTSDPDFATGDRVRLARNEIPEGSPPGIDQYTFSDYDRRGPMLWLLAGFAAVVVL